MKLYYEHEGITIYHGDARDVTAAIGGVLITDPPFGIGYESGRDGTLARSIQGDADVSLRDGILARWTGPALVFGSWRRERPAATRSLLVWDTGGALGMGALDIPWKPSHQEIYVIGGPWAGGRSSDVLRFPPVQSSAWRGREHPHEKPVPLLRELVRKTPPGYDIFDPFMGVGTTLRAAKDLGRKAIGIEIEEMYCEIAAKRLSQEVLL